MSNDSAVAKPGQRRFRFSLQALLILVLLLASYCAGWVSHRTWNQRNVQEAVTKAVEQFNDDVQVDMDKDLDVLMIRGTEDGVQRMEDAIRDVETAASR